VFFSFLVVALAQLTGLITSAVDWGQILGNLFTADVSGVDVVLETKTQTYTYHVENGNSTLEYVVVMMLLFISTNANADVRVLPYKLHPPS